MKKILLLIVMLFGLSSCSIFSPVHSCQYTQRDLTVSWEERLYWCEK